MATKNNKNEQSFEDSLKALEAVVESMESGDVPLEKLVEQFEQGKKLLGHCNSKLKEAELRIEQLKTDGDQNKFEDFGA